MQNSLDEAQFLHPSNEEDKLIKAQVCQFHGQRELHDNLVRRDKFSRALSQDDVESDSQMLSRGGSDDDDEAADEKTASTHRRRALKMKFSGHWPTRKIGICPTVAIFSSSKLP